MGMFKRYVVCAVLLLLAACKQEPTLDRPEILRFEVAPTAVTAGETVTYSWQVEGTSCELDVDSDGTPEYTPDCATGSQAHVFGEAGSFAGTLAVTRGTPKVTATAAVTVSEQREPPLTPPGPLTWRPAARQPYGVAEAQGVAVGGKLYVFGGFDARKRCCTPTARAHVFDPGTNRWRALRAMPDMNSTGHGGVTHAGVATDGTDIFLASGYSSSPSGRGQIFGSREVWRYRVSGNSYDRLPDLPVARAAGQLEYLDGKLYYFGGTNRSRTADTSNLYILDLASGATTWREGARLPNGRNHMGSAVLGGKIYAIGGQHDHDQRLRTQRDVHAYSPETDSWQKLANLPRPLSHIANSTFVSGGRILAIGGEVANFDAVDTVFAYTPETNSWESLTPLPLAIQSTVAKRVGDQIVVTGGSAGGWRAETYLGTPLE